MAVKQSSIDSIWLQQIQLPGKRDLRSVVFFFFTREPEGLSVSKAVPFVLL